MVGGPALSVSPRPGLIFGRYLLIFALIAVSVLSDHHLPKKYITPRAPLRLEVRHLQFLEYILDTEADLLYNSKRATSPPQDHSGITCSAKMTSAIVTPLKCPEGSKIDFGATVSGVDIENLTGKTMK